MAKLLILLTFLAAACSKSEPPAKQMEVETKTETLNQPADTAAPTENPNEAVRGDDQLALKGAKLYRFHCIACHAADPRKSGASGPEVFGASMELLEARILRAEYPHGYKPKRGTRTMVKMPYLKNDLAAIHAFLNSPAAK
jgi:mono/diheme cytochrome c family protein